VLDGLSRLVSEGGCLIRCEGEVWQSRCVEVAERFHFEVEKVQQSRFEVVAAEQFHCGLEVVEQSRFEEESTHQFHWVLETNGLAHSAKAGL